MLHDTLQNKDGRIGVQGQYQVGEPALCDQALPEGDGEGPGIADEGCCQQSISHQLACTRSRGAERQGRGRLGRQPACCALS